MKASQLIPAIRAARAVRRPVFIEGAPGIGKTAIVGEAAKLDGCKLLTYILALKESVDLMGIPELRKGRTYWNPPGDLPDKGDWYIFLDEFPQAAIPTMNAASGLIFGGRMGSYEVPEGAYVCAAGNGQEHMAAVNRMPTHIANRFLHLYMHVDALDWGDWASRNKIDLRAQAFIQYRPALLHCFDPRSKEKAFASPRAWDFLSQVLPFWLHDFRGAELTELICGVVGKAAGTEFAGFLPIMDTLIDLDKVEKDPDHAPIASDAAVLYAMTYALSERCKRANIEALARYMKRVSADFANLFYRRIAIVTPDLKKSKQFIAWASANQNML